MSAPRSVMTPGIILILLAAGLLFTAGIIGVVASDVVAPLSANLATFLQTNWLWLIGGGVILDGYGVFALIARARSAAAERPPES